MFFESSEQLSQTQLIPLVIDAALDLGGRPGRRQIIERAIELGGITDEELAVPTHRAREREQGWNAVWGRLYYAIFAARERGEMRNGRTDDRQEVTFRGLDRAGDPTGYVELDRRRRMSAGMPAPGIPRSPELRPYKRKRSSTSSDLAAELALARIDLDDLDRRTRQHHELEHHVYERLCQLGWSGGSPPSSVEVPCDLVMCRDGQWLVVEVKTLGHMRSLDRQQIRSGLGQVLSYRHLLRRHNRQTDAVIVVSAALDEPWPDVLADVDVGVWWPGADDGALAGA